MPRWFAVPFSSWWITSWSNLVGLPVQSPAAPATHRRWAMVRPYCGKHGPITRMGDGHGPMTTRLGPVTRMGDGHGPTTTRPGRLTLAGDGCHLSTAKPGPVTRMRDGHDRSGAASRVRKIDATTPAIP